MANYIIGGLVGVAFVYGLYRVYQNFTGKSGCCGTDSGGCDSCCACKPRK